MDRKLSFREITDIFNTLDKNGDGKITHAEFIIGLKRHAWIAEKLGMPAHVRQEDGSRETYQLSFGMIDNDNSKTIEFKELCAFFGYYSDGDHMSDWSQQSLPQSSAATPRATSAPATPNPGKQKSLGGVGTSGAAKASGQQALTALEVINIFKTLDINGDGEVFRG
jgi:hypothetical protein